MIADYALVALRRLLGDTEQPGCAVVIASTPLGPWVDVAGDPDAEDLADLLEFVATGLAEARLEAGRQEATPSTAITDRARDAWWHRQQFRLALHRPPMLDPAWRRRRRRGGPS